jgi:pSer/pThr/pTyr-binding forkhead associated (FHA) protein
MDHVDSISCTRCGHVNPAGSRFCNSCGSILDVPVDHTGSVPVVLIPPVDPGQESSLPDDDIVFDRSTIPAGEAVLVVRSLHEAGTVVPLTGALVRLGRHPRSEVFLDDVTVSRRHVEIARVGGRFVARDVGSLNGTYVNRERIDARELHDGDELQIGKFKLVFFQG